MAQSLRALAPLSEDRGSIPRTYMTTHNQLLQGIQHLLLASLGPRHTCGKQVYIAILILCM